MRNTRQRDIVLGVVRSSSDHPTAETVYERARKIIPNISLGTVYRNLKLLGDVGKIRVVRSDDDTLRFDKTVYPHAHVRCVMCGKVVDAAEINVEALTESASFGNGFEVTGAEVSFTGICPECGNNAKANKEYKENKNG